MTATANDRPTDDHQRRTSGRGIQPLHIVVAVILTVLVVGLVATLTGAKPPAQQTPMPGAATSPADQPAASAEPAPADDEMAEQRKQQEEMLRSLARRDPDDPAAIGRVDAPVVLIEWSDYRCPFCSAFNEDTLPKLQRYVDEGKLRIEFRDLAVFGKDSEYAAVAARAAARQGKHHEFMNALFAKLPNNGHPPVNEAIVTDVARQIGVPDMAKFTQDLASKELRDAVLAESFEAQQMGLSSVPAFVVGGQFVAGAQPIEVFEQVIEQELRKAGA